MKFAFHHVHHVVYENANQGINVTNIPIGWENIDSPIKSIVRYTHFFYGLFNCV
jgi:hypothetical protein